MDKRTFFFYNTLTMKRYIPLQCILIILLLLILISCGNEPPIITFPNYSILTYEGGSLNNPTDIMFLSIYFVLQDDNGIEDVNRIRVIHTDSEFSWELPLEVLQRTAIWQEKNYVGYPYLEYDNGKSILTGEYVI